MIYLFNISGILLTGLLCHIFFSLSLAKNQILIYVLSGIFSHILGTAYPSGTPEFTPGFWWSSCYSIFIVMCNVLQIVVCPFFVLFLLATVLSVLLRFSDSYYHVGIFKLFLSPFMEPLNIELDLRHPSVDMGSRNALKHLGTLKTREYL